MDSYVHFVYRLTKHFPKEEIFGTTSQLKRATLSVVLNFIEGYAREQGKTNKNYMSIAYGSLQESKYLIEFCQVEGFINNEEANEVLKMADEIGAILWRITHNNK